MCRLIHILLTATVLASLLRVRTVRAQFSNVPSGFNADGGSPINTDGATNTGVSGTTYPTYQSNTKSSAIKEALADAIRLRAEAQKEKVLAKHGGATTDASSTQTEPVAKTKSFAYTSIRVPGANANP
jgi:hypothetical protein